MKCKDCDVPPTYDYAENCSLCGLFGWDNDDEHFKELACFITKKSAETETFFYVQ